MDGCFKYKINNIPVLYEDDCLLIVDKPPGLLTIPAPGNKQPTLTDILNRGVKNGGVSYRLHPCHRLDKDTSGLIVYAKGKSIQKRMMELFKGKKIKKIYVAFVQGRLSQDKGQISYPIQGQSALTEYRIIETRKDFSVLEVMPLTGRKNQIRIHFNTIGHPVVGEKKFAFRRDYQLRANRLCLHAKALEFTHPAVKKTVSVISELSTGMKNFLEKH
ncbi:MAG: RNA pseudouridine synthase [Candidatus Omnitrophica bacterium]|nr:RNA pseudouridine synthase [Candidatus Omnitrophota bacterium]MBU4346308.1 RNA pseudouridine synthase [Candidatus Omnitrophota bacterium]MBU4473208.1 RNA pseudouridine synthase [Candidatus Omnitrophota bacterium]MCG2706571.1 RNA pseudouridine synthase [Candidatus Omnitrophota bacterium]